MTLPKRARAIQFWKALGGRPSANLERSLTGLGEERSIRAILLDTLQRLVFVSLPVDTLTAEMLDEINSCINITGRVGHLKERLEAMHAVPEAKPHR